MMMIRFVVMLIISSIAVSNGATYEINGRSCQCTLLNKERTWVEFGVQTALPMAFPAHGAVTKGSIAAYECYHGRMASCAINAGSAVLYVIGLGTVKDATEIVAKTLTPHVTEVVSIYGPQMADFLTENFPSAGGDIAMKLAPYFVRTTTLTTVTTNALEVSPGWFSSTVTTVSQTVASVTQKEFGERFTATVVEETITQTTNYFLFSVSYTITNNVVSYSFEKVAENAANEILQKTIENTLKEAGYIIGEALVSLSTDQFKNNANANKMSCTCSSNQTKASP